MKKLMALISVFVCMVIVTGCTLKSERSISQNSAQKTNSSEQVNSISTQNTDSSEQVNNISTPNADNNEQVNNISEYITEEDGIQRLILPISKVKIHIRDEYKKHLDNIDVELLKTAEETINNQIESYTYKDAPCFSLKEDDSGYLCLSTECIVDINPPNTRSGKNGEIIDSGCNIDHKHIFFSERITK